MTSRRLFVAVPLDDPVARAIAGLVERIRADRARDAPAERDVRWVRMDALHLTLRFLGATPEDQVPAVTEVVRRAAEGGGTFPLQIDGGGAFPSLDRPRTLWLAVAHGAGQLATLAGALNRGLQVAGWPADERPFRAHLTVARSDGIRAGRDVARRLVEAAAGIDLRMIADSVVLYESVSGRGAPRYEPLERVPLRLHGAPLER